MLTAGGGRTPFRLSSSQNILGLTEPHPKKKLGGLHLLIFGKHPSHHFLKHFLGPQKTGERGRLDITKTRKMEKSKKKSKI